MFSADIESPTTILIRRPAREKNDTRTTRYLCGQRNIFLRRFYSKMYNGKKSPVVG